MGDLWVLTVLDSAMSAMRAKYAVGNELLSGVR